MAPELVVQGVNIVLRGDFNPAILQPSWFARYDLIKPQEADAAEIKIICSDAAIFEMEWLQLQAVRDRLQIGTVRESYYEVLRDLAVGICTLLPHTPIKGLGINRDFHFRMPSEEAWHAVGHTVAPKEPWQGILTRPGMRSLAMQEDRTDDQYPGYLLVKIEPSVRAQPYGIYININDHYQSSTGPDSSLVVDEILAVLHERWESSMQRGLEIAQKIVGIGGRTWQ